ncbi:MAG: nucleotidyltransferase domain-containing protein [Planctomycetota bacterium]|jgi:predicted nucleotidyltransferase
MADIHTLISSRIRIELLKILALNPESTFNINELSRRTGFSLRGVEKELKNLLSGGILRKEVSGNQHRYQLDPSCPINREIKGIITKTVGIIELVKQALISVEQRIERAFIYGSFASGDYGNDSDVDLFIVTELSGLQLTELLGEVQNEIGRSINVSQFTLDEFKRRKEQNDHFLNRVLESPQINISGYRNES